VEGSGVAAKVDRPVVQLLSDPMKGVRKGRRGLGPGGRTLRDRFGPSKAEETVWVPFRLNFAGEEKE